MRSLCDAPGAIDGHTHLFDEADYVARFLEACAACGIARSVVSGLGPAWGMLDNAGILRAAERHPDRLIPLAFIEIGRDRPDAVARAKRQGFRGLKVSARSFPYDDPRAFPLYAKAAELDLPLLFHCGVLAHVRGVMTSSEYMRPMRIDGIARRFPDLRIQIAHLGVPEYEVATTLARIVPNIFVDITGNPCEGWYTAKTPAFMRALFHWRAWHRKLIFGTDVRYEAIPAAIRAHERLLSALKMTRAVREAVYRDNAREFLGEIRRPAYIQATLMTKPAASGRRGT